MILHTSHALSPSDEGNFNLTVGFPIGAAALVLSLQPLSNVELWWQLVRGRTVMSGEWAPSRFLLSHEVLANGDWLNGTIAWGVFLWGGIAGLMVLKIFVALFTGGRLLKKCGRSFQRTFFCLTLLVAVQPVFDPSSSTFDFLSILLVAALAQKQRYFSIAAWAVVWANFSTGAIWVIPVFVAFVHHGRMVGVRGTAIWVCALLVCLSLTPRGPLSAVDMLVLAVPWLFNEAVFLTGTGYSNSPVTMSVMAAIFMGLSALVLPGTVRSRKIIVVVLTGVGVMTVRYLPLAATVSGLILIDLPDNVRLKKLSHFKGMRVVVSAIAATIVIWNVAGGIGGRSDRLGWGIADSIDLRFTERDLQQHQNSHLKAHCTDVNGAGLLLMACRSVQVLDVPEAAIRGDRLQEFWLMNHDLATGRKVSFIRQNGTEGGWWCELINKDVSLLVVSPKRQAVLTSLEPTLWKPLSLDSPQLVFGVAGIRRFNSQILTTRSQRDLFEYGGWRHELYCRTSVPSHTDLWAATTGFLDVRADIRQAGVFRAMAMNVAAVRTILPVLDFGGRPSCQQEFLKIQQQFAWYEWLNSGQVSALRRQVLHRLQSEVSVPGVPEGELVSDKTAAIPNDAILSYCSGDLTAATAALTSQTVEAQYAKHVFQWESGDSRNADTTLSMMEAAYPDHPLTAMIRLQRDVQ